MFRLTTTVCRAAPRAMTSSSTSAVSAGLRRSFQPHSQLKNMHHRFFSGGQPARDPFKDLASNPKAMKILSAIQRDPQLLGLVQQLGTLLQSKGLVDPKNPLKQPTPWEMAKIMMEKDVRELVFKLVERLKASGIDMESEQQAGGANGGGGIMKMLFGGGLSAPPPPPPPASSSTPGVVEGRVTDEPKSSGKLSDFFKRK